MVAKSALLPADSVRPLYVFLGPTLQRRPSHGGVTILPPVARGVLSSLVRKHGGRVDLAIVDAAFRCRRDELVEEARSALHDGARVFGASALGAIVAADLGGEGAVGVGRIHDAFARREIDGDDEIRVAHADAAGRYAPCSEALVDIRATLTRALEAGGISDQTHDALLDIARVTFFAARTYPMLVSRGHEMGLLRREVDYVRQLHAETPRSQKDDDALELMDHLASLVTFRHRQSEPLSFEGTA